MHSFAALATQDLMGRPSQEGPHGKAAKPLSDAVVTELFTF
jgi:hypothetical protein